MPDYTPWLNKIFTFESEQYKVVGIKPERRKFPMIIEKLSGYGTGSRRMLFELPILKMLLGELQTVAEPMSFYFASASGEE